MARPVATLPRLLYTKLEHNACECNLYAKSETALHGQALLRRLRSRETFCHARTHTSFFPERCRSLSVWASWFSRLLDVARSCSAATLHSRVSSTLAWDQAVEHIECAGQWLWYVAPQEYTTQSWHLWTSCSSSGATTTQLLCLQHEALTRLPSASHFFKRLAFSAAHASDHPALPSYFRLRLVSCAV